MKLSAMGLAAVVLAAAPARGPEATSRWLRVVTPAVKSPMAAQCVVLDADVFAHAGPGLKDVRLMQDGQELPYAMDESHDDAGEAAGDDRAFYEPSLVIAARPADVAGGFYGEGELLARVPVERVRLEQDGTGEERLGLKASPVNDLAVAESLDTVLPKGSLSSQFTIGANLQGNADVRVSAQGGVERVKRFVLEMRRREICYQPVSASPVQMLFGDEKAELRHYAFARSFRPVAVPVLGSLGGRVANPAFVEAVPAVVVSRLQRLVLGWMAGLTVLVLLAAPLLRVRR